MNEAENTMRTLAEKPLLVTSRWCFFGLHKWTKYGKPGGRTEGPYHVDYQVRECASCGLKDVKILRKVYK